MIQPLPSSLPSSKHSQSHSLHSSHTPAVPAPCLRAFVPAFRFSAAPPGATPVVSTWLALSFKCLPKCYFLAALSESPCSSFTLLTPHPLSVVTLCYHSVVSDFVTRQISACQAFLVRGFSRQDNQSGLSFPSPSVTLTSFSINDIIYYSKP